MPASITRLVAAVQQATPTPEPTGSPSLTPTPTPTVDPTQTPLPSPAEVVHVASLAPDQWGFLALGVVLVVFGVGFLVAKAF